MLDRLGNELRGRFKDLRVFLSREIRKRNRDGSTESPPRATGVTALSDRLPRSANLNPPAHPASPSRSRNQHLTNQGVQLLIGNEELAKRGAGRPELRELLMRKAVRLIRPGELG